MVVWLPVWRSRPMLFATRRVLTFVLVALVVVLSVAVRPVSADAATAYYLAPTGADTNPGTQSAPFKTFTVAMKKLRPGDTLVRSEEHTSELQSRQYLVCRLLLEKKNSTMTMRTYTLPSK